MSDLEDVVDMAEAFAIESPYATHKPDPLKVRHLVEEILDKPLKDGMIFIALDHGKPVGFIAAAAMESFFFTGRVAQELAWWVTPSYRGGSTGIKLLQVFEVWARDVAEADFCTMASIKGPHSEALDKLYLRLGYSQDESTYTKVF